jgi:hypothetical protein
MPSGANLNPDIICQLTVLFSRGGNYFPGGSPWFIFHARIGKSKLTIIETFNIALNSSFIGLSKSLFMAFTRPIQQKLCVWQAAGPNRGVSPLVYVRLGLACLLALLAWYLVLK